MRENPFTQLVMSSTFLSARSSVSFFVTDESARFVFSAIVPFEPSLRALRRPGRCPTHLDHRRNVAGWTPSGKACPLVTCCRGMFTCQTR